jgi:hypothetical protein
MPFLVILKRFEVWLLLAIVVALIVFAMQPPPPLAGTVAVATDPSGTQNQPPSVSLTDSRPPSLPTPAAAPSLAIREVRVTASSPGYIVETFIGGGSGRASDLVLSDDQVRATTADGQPVNRFFEPFQETPTLLASGDAVASLRWWLPSPVKSIWIEIDGERIEANLP